MSESVFFDLLGQVNGQEVESKLLQQQKATLLDAMQTLLDPDDNTVLPGVREAQLANAAEKMRDFLRQKDKPLIPRNVAQIVVQRVRGSIPAITPAIMGSRNQTAIGQLNMLNHATNELEGELANAPPDQTQFDASMITQLFGTLTKEFAPPTPAGVRGPKKKKQKTVGVCEFHKRRKEYADGHCHQCYVFYDILRMYCRLLVRMEHTKSVPLSIKQSLEGALKEGAAKVFKRGHWKKSKAPVADMNKLLEIMQNAFQKTFTSKVAKEDSIKDQRWVRQFRDITGSNPEGVEIEEDPEDEEEEEEEDEEDGGSEEEGEEEGDEEIAEVEVQYEPMEVSVEDNSEDKNFNGDEEEEESSSSSEQEEVKVPPSIMHNRGASAPIVHDGGQSIQWMLNAMQEDASQVAEHFRAFLVALKENNVQGIQAAIQQYKTRVASYEAVWVYGGDSALGFPPRIGVPGRFASREEATQAANGCLPLELREKYSLSIKSREQ